MADLVYVLPSFPTTAYSHLLPSLEKNLITTTDLITLDALEIAKRARLPVLDVRNLANAILAELKGELGVRRDAGKETENKEDEEGRSRLFSNGRELVQRWSTISTMDGVLDRALGGGIPTGYVTEITGESGVGKTQFLLQLLLSSQLAPPVGLRRPSLYISTESPLSTARLSSLLSSHPVLSKLPPSQKPSLDSILTITVSDLESQDHILRYQLPVTVRRHNIGLVALDSVAANYRAEFEGRIAGGSVALARRAAELVRLGALLRDLARERDVAVVVANQVSDRFGPLVGLPHTTTTKLDSGPLAGGKALLASKPSTTTTISDLMALDHQQRWFSGWGDDPAQDPAGLKTPSLGHAWTLQISARIVLFRDENHGGGVGERASVGARRKGRMKVAFAPWVEGAVDGVAFEIAREGVRGIEAGKGGTGA